MSSLWHAFYLWHLKKRGIAVSRGLGSSGGTGASLSFSLTHFLPVTLDASPWIHKFISVKRILGTYPTDTATCTVLCMSFKPGDTISLFLSSLPRSHFILKSHKYFYAQSLSWLKTAFISLNHRVVGVGRNLSGWSSRTPLLQQIPLQQVAQDCL